MTTRYRKRLRSRMAAHRLGYHRPGLKARWSKPKSLFRAFRRGHDRTSGFYGKYRGGRNMELKFHDIDIDDAVIAQAGTITDSINKIAQGTTEVTRIGRKCTIKSINWRYDLIMAAATSSSAASDVVRIILYLDKQCNGATATATAILESDDYQSFNNLANKSRFRTLMDRTYSLNAQAGGGDGTTEDYAENITHDSFYKKCNIPVEFDSTAGAITEIRSNNIGILVLSKVGGIATFTSKLRIRFSDM